MSYEVFQQGPSTYVPYILVSLVVTVIAYGMIPVIVAKTRKGPITKKKYLFICYGLNFLLMIIFALLDNRSSMAPYLLWTWIFTKRGLNTLEYRKVLKRLGGNDSEDNLDNSTDAPGGLPNVPDENQNNDVLVPTPDKKRESPYVESGNIREPVKENVNTSFVQKRSIPVWMWLLTITLVLGLCVSMSYNYFQHTQIGGLEDQITELQNKEENASNYLKLLSSMQNVNESNYRAIGTLLNTFPPGYEDTNIIRTQYNELRKYISTIESSVLTTRSCEELRSAYTNLYKFNKRFHNWDVSSYLNESVYRNHYKKLIFGYKWSDGNNYFYWYEDNDGKRLLTNLPSSKKNWIEYYYTTSGYDDTLVFGYENVKDSDDQFDAFEIVDVIYLDGKWSISLYCFSNDRIYVLN